MNDRVFVRLDEHCTAVIVKCMGSATVVWKMTGWLTVDESGTMIQSIDKKGKQKR